MEALIWGLPGSQGALCCMGSGLNTDDQGLRAVTPAGGEGAPSGHTPFPCSPGGDGREPSFQGPRGRHPWVAFPSQVEAPRGKGGSHVRGLPSSQCGLSQGPVAQGLGHHVASVEGGRQVTARGQSTPHGVEPQPPAGHLDGTLHVCSMPHVRTALCARFIGCSTNTAGG